MSELIQFRRDCWRYPLVLPGGSFTLLQGATIRVGSFQAGTYYATDNVTGTPIPTSAALFTALAARLQLAFTTGTVTVRAADSVGDGDIGAERIVINWNGGTWTLNTQTNATWFNALGFDASQGAYVSLPNGDLHATWSYAGAWWTHNPWSGAASSKVPFRTSESNYSSQRTWDSTLVVWSQIEGRVYSYAHLPSARINRGRSLDPNRAALADLVLGDPNATFEPVWNALQNPATAVYVSNDLEPLDGLSTVGADRFERVQLLTPWQNYPDNFTDMQLAGDYWSFELAVRTLNRTYPF